MNKTVLIISPHFPPINSADMHRVRQMLNYLSQNGWNAEIVSVDSKFIESYSVDLLLNQTIPYDTIVHYVKAWSFKKTRKFGLGSLSIRSYWFYKKKVNCILSRGKIDLIFFSTTAFHLLALGPYWKKKFGIPFVVDIQDPWRSDFYLDKPKNKRPPKFLISYLIDRFLEKKTIPLADGVISVSQDYIDTFKSRYKRFTSIYSVIPFAIDATDFELIRNNKIEKYTQFEDKKINILYIGRGGHDLEFAVDLFFKGVNEFAKIQPEKFNLLRCYFLGTSYALAGTGIKTILPIAVRNNLAKLVTENTDRLPYFTTLDLLKQADILFIPGSIDEGYTASKIYPYVLAEKPLITIFNEKSSVNQILTNCTKASVITFANGVCSKNAIIEKVAEELSTQIDNIGVDMPYNKISFERYLASSMTKAVTEIFNKVVSK